MFFIEIENNVIKRFCCGDFVPENAVQVDSNWSGKTGESVDFYNPDWTRKSEVQLIKEGLEEMPSTKKWNDDKTVLVNKTDIEMYIDGTKQLPKGMKIENGSLVEMTGEEKVEAGLITQEQLNEQKIIELKDYLRDTDYVTIKIMEGVATKEDYADILKKREKAREEINKLEN